MGYIRPFGGYPTGPAAVEQGDVLLPTLTETLPLLFAFLWVGIGMAVVVQSVALRCTTFRHQQMKHVQLNIRERCTLMSGLCLYYTFMCCIAMYYFDTRERYAAALVFFDVQFCCFWFALLLLPTLRVCAVAKCRSQRSIGIDSTTENPAFDSTRPIMARGQMRVRGFHESITGTVLRFALCLGSMSWLFVVAAVLLGYYHNCQFTGIDNSCFYGDYFIFGSYANNSNILFQSWWLMFLWFTPQIFLRKRIFTWCMEPCPLQDADYAWVWVPESQQNCSMATSSSAVVRTVRWCRALVSMFSYSFGGREGTVKIVRSSGQDFPKFFTFECVRYAILQTSADSTTSTRLVAEQHGFQRAVVNLDFSVASLHATASGMEINEAESRLQFVGPNLIPYEVDSLSEAVVNEFGRAFYLYQFLIYVVWFWFSYIFVASFLAGLVIFSGFVNIVIARSNQRTIAALTSTAGSITILRREGTENGATRMQIDSRDLVPGDLVIVEPGCVLPCDMVIMQGGVVCDESGLTGESMPVRKVAISQPMVGEDVKYDPEHKDAKHTLFAGCRVLETAPGSLGADVRAMVTYTGIHTSRGQLVAHILFPHPMRFVYDEELPVVLLVLGVCCIVIFYIAQYMQELSGQPKSGISAWAYGLFTVSQTISPLLPLSLIVGQTASFKRLKEQGINCINPKRIAIAGKVRCFCFDKTGTLTKDGLECIGVHHIANLECNKPPKFADFTATSAVTVKDSLKHSRADPCILAGLATCHAVTQFGTQLVGNQVEVQMFSLTGFVLEESCGVVRVRDPKSKRAFEILKRFEFDHSRMMMSVIVVDLDTSETFVFAKGAPERTAVLCEASSLPRDLSQMAASHAMAGCYVLGMAFRRLQFSCVEERIRFLTEVSRDQIECNLTFTGLLLFRNEIKPDTRAALAELRAGDVRCVMITGDNAQCGLYIAKNSGMISDGETVIVGEMHKAEDFASVSIAPDNDGVVWRSTEETAQYSTTNVLELLRQNNSDARVELMVSGAAWQSICNCAQFSDSVLNFLLLRVRVFARVTPEGKETIVRRHISAGLVVGMCGDGGNDCGALRVAHVGVALSEAEASVVSPFTSSRKTIQDCVALLREGRCALATSFAGYKFVIMYGQIFPLVKLWCFYFGVIMPMLDYLFIDVVLVMSLSAAITCSSPLDSLGTHRPTASLLGTTTVASVLGPTIMNMICLLLAIRMISSDPNYIEFPASLSQGASWWTLGDNWESTTLFVCFAHQFVTSALSFSLGSRFRKAVFSNRALLALCGCFYLLFGYILLAEPNKLSATFHIASINYNSNGTESPVWKSYQDECTKKCMESHGGERVHRHCQHTCWTPGMPFELRLRLWLHSMIFSSLEFFWEFVVVQGPVRDFLRERYPKASVVLKL